MQLTKFTHACVRLEKQGSVLAIDPGTFSEASEALAGAKLVLITHEHGDHLDPAALATALAASPDLLIYAPAGVAQTLREANPEAAERIHSAAPGENFEAAGFSIRTFGGQHALVNPQLPVAANIGYLVDGNLYHPGDSLIVPAGVSVQTLLVPIHAPWSKTSEIVDFVSSVRAPKAYQIHDALLSELGLQFTEAHVNNLAGPYGVEFRHLAVRESVEI
ncbi:L-ascorbate metabolism protein UlaG (beta-lactamase superfamily) [Psychromicrobium silvestre]|uniref:L-ascorbate metabolism protein UlaG (Beta-lactamase superfamily) n=1 Tax=Psychromicrobium silvestre TaxID=1645614 RepID=A0A7Y9S6X0_9MICC|nr:MBL fold metallo-hydrolase [Psychromicrobium silvestre]NYE94836.1 L-ascorbate metabolism protein UlaG (beta-lactamase superfamily) [Psychromicrobium silvestre]